jgi:uridylate kinase
MRITIGLGGSVFAAEDLDVEFLREAAGVFRELTSQGHEILVVVGGGKSARRYIEAARELGASDKDCDEIGISVTRLNARLLVKALGDLAEPRPVESFERAIRVMLKKKIPVMGGTFPGQTTDAVAAGLANSSMSELLIFFVDVGGIYTSDPKRHSEARKLETIEASELVKLAQDVKMKPGVTVIVDPLAARLIQRSRLRTLVLGREDLRQLPTIIKGGEHSGTTVLPGDSNSRT